jgi:hypothetical protein
MDGSFFGSWRHWLPVEERFWIALTTICRQVIWECPICWVAGMNSSINAHAASVSLLANRRLAPPVLPVSGLGPNHHEFH